MNNQKITHIVAFGDSFVEGYIRNSPYEDNKKANQISFVNQLKYYSDYIKTSSNFGAHGDANQKICYDCFKWLRKNNFSNTFVLISFTHPNRQAYYKREIDDYAMAKSNIWADEHIAFSKYALILLIHEILHQKNIPHLFVESFLGSPFQKFSFETSSTMNNSKSLRDVELFSIPIRIPYLTTPLIDMTRKITACYHPSRDGHKEIAKYLSKYIDNTIKNFQIKEK